MAWRTLTAEVSAGAGLTGPRWFGNRRALSISVSWFYRRNILGVRHAKECWGEDGETCVTSARTDAM